MDYKRRFVVLSTPMLAFGLSKFANATGSSSAASSVSVIDAYVLPEAERKQHEHYMNIAIGLIKGEGASPYAAIIVDPKTGKVMSEGLNNATENPTFHGEILAINQYVSRHGNKNWQDMTLYTTAEPCPMCMGALILAGVRNIVWATSIRDTLQLGGKQINLPAKEIVARAEGYKDQAKLIAGILKDQTTPLLIKFWNRKPNVGLGSHS